MHHIGHVERLQVQLARLKTGEKPHQVYDPVSLRVVPALRVTQKGVVGLADGQELLDVHHTDHEYSRNRPGAGVSFNFDSHYERMREHLNPHLQTGCAGENILITADRRFELSALSGGVAIETNDGTLIQLSQISVAHPCVPFSRYALNVESNPTDVKIKDTLIFLDGGMRGFYAELAGEPAIVCPGDRVFIA